MACLRLTYTTLAVRLIVLMGKTDNRKLLWESEHKTGNWTHLQGEHEFAHYTLVAGYLQRLGQQITLLDLGCGQGVILKYLNRDLIGKYTGVDVAQAALDRITLRPKDELICSSLEDYEPNEKWDVVLFNEILYYTKDPVAHLKKFETALTPRGFFVVSIHRKPNPMAWNNRCMRRVQAYFRTSSYVIEDGVTLSKLYEPSKWDILIARPERS